MAYGGIANTGMGILRVGTDAKVGAIWANGNVDLRDRAEVWCDIQLSLSAAISEGNDVDVNGIVSSDLSSATRDVLSGGGPPGPSGGDVMLPPDLVLALAPGHYGRVTVNARARLILSAGEYSFSDLHAESGSKIEVPTDCTQARVRTRQTLFFRGEVVGGSNTTASGLTIVHEGQNTAHIETPFSGVVMAPSSELILSSHDHSGRFYAKKLRVQSGATIVGRSQCKQTDPASASNFVESAVRGPAPPLDGPENLDAFLDWFLGMTAAEHDVAEARIARVSNFSTVAGAVATKLQQARVQGQLGEVLLLTSFLGAMVSPAAEDALRAIAEEPIAVPRDLTEESPYEIEVAYRRQAIFALGKRGTETSTSTLRSIALGSAYPELRAIAI